MAAIHSGDADLSMIQDREVAVIGFGAEARAHCLNLRDSGVDVRVGLAPSSSGIPAAQAEGLPVMSITQACQEADVIAVLLADEQIPTIYAEHIAAHLGDGDALVFPRGFSVHFGQVEPPRGVDVCLVSVEESGATMRRHYEDGHAVPALLGVHQDATGRAWDLAKAYTKAIGGLRNDAFVTTMGEQTQAELFSEQVVHGGLAQLVRMGFETLVQAGCQPEVAHLEMRHVLKDVVDQMTEGRGNTSQDATAEYGGLLAGTRVIDGHVRAAMKAVLDDIGSGQFANRFRADQEAGAPELAQLRAEHASHQLVRTDERMRSRFGC